MKNLITVIFVLLYFPFLAQEFFTDFTFEDAQGRKDTLTIGAVEDIHDYDIVDLQDAPLKELDVRFLEYINLTPADPLFLFGGCDNEDGDVSLDTPVVHIDYESKNFYGWAGNCSESTGGFFVEVMIPKASSFPITITWDNIPFQDSCRSGSYLSEIPILFFYTTQGSDALNWCEERVNHPKVSLARTNKLVLNEPSFLTLQRFDSTIVSVYYLYVSTSNIEGEIVTNVGNLEDSKITVYPNPVKDKLYLETAKPNWNYQILNLQGLQVSQGVYHNNISLSQLPSGIYFLQLQREGELYKAIKFVKE